jgi:hypothetical protein
LCINTVKNDIEVFARAISGGDRTSTVTYSYRSYPAAGCGSGKTELKNFD